MFLLLIVFVASCASQPPTPPPIRAVYLVKGRGQLSPDDLQKHAEVMVTNSFDEFKRHSKKPVALWIDKNAVRLIWSESGTPGQWQWLDQAPQAYYPMVLVGYSAWLDSFRDNLHPMLFCAVPWLIGVCTQSDPVLA